MTATRTYQVAEKQVADGPQKGVVFELSDASGFVLHRAHGPTRELAIQGLKDYGFTLDGVENTPDA